ncbi:U32 family peptidase C-terminal domain-containing protein [bacterium]|nr:U32 family peptidase C-terminal domain-containing protein [bacterium]
MAELLLPAGNIEKMEYAIQYGADAVYLGMVDFSLRTMRKGSLITRENLKDAIARAHELGKKAYLTVNIFAFENDINKLYENIEVIREASPDAIIVSDFGVFNIIRRELPEIDIHISTQTNTLNSEAVKFWQGLGAKRVILARELSYKQIEKMVSDCPDIELECFVHGSQCMSFSGRCLLSDFMTKNSRKANSGGCAQPCRWSYKLLEETRPGEYYEICQDNHGSHILSPKDLCLIEHIQNLRDAGVASFKIEGRTKSLYYVSATARAYRMVLDGKISARDGFNELLKVGNRGYTKGFFLGDNNSESYSYDISKGLAGADFLGIVLGEENGFLRVEIKNKMTTGETVEIITPDESIEAKIVAIKSEKEQNLFVANTNDVVLMQFDKLPSNIQYALIRTVGITDKRIEVKQKDKKMPLKGYLPILKGRIKPDLNLKSIYELQEHLDKFNLTTLLFDLDSTLCASKSGVIEPRVQQLLFELAKKYKLAIISNNYNKEYTQKLQAQTKVKIYDSSRKPDVLGVMQALSELNSIPEETMIVGDRPLTDILAGKNAKLKTALVDSITADTEPKLTRFVRRLERLFIK